ncbi:MAG: DUF6452 family protein [Prevotella sp.]
MRKIMLAVLAAITACACSSIDCPVQNSVYTNYALYKADGTKDTLQDTLSVLTFTAAGQDTIVFNRGVGLTGFSLPISYVNPCDTFYFGLKQEGDDTQWITDRVCINKLNTPRFESVDCQVAYFHTITSVETTHNFIDSIVINNPNVDYETERQHFRIYFTKR